MKKFKYQAIYKISDYENVVFVGSTDLGLDDLLNQCDEMFDLSIEPNLLAVNYEPINFKMNDETKEP